MTKTTSAIKAFINMYDSQPWGYQDLDHAVEAICCSTQFRSLLLSLIDSKAFSPELGQEFAAVGAIKGLLATKNSWGCTAELFPNTR
ncbi:MAG: hypothetical protein F6K41_35535 [Symploca sp. SIO3E6]|nr:hypothetical protein [Caldora sp. SIO3E6]